MAKSVEGQEPEEITAPEGVKPKENVTPDPWEKFPAEFNWVRKELEEARKGEAAKRVEAKELKEKLAEAKTPEEVQKLLADSEARVAAVELEKNRVLAARNAKLPEELDEFITGTTQEEIDAQVKKLAALRPAPQDDDEEEPHVTKPRPRGGMNPANGPDGRDGHAEYEAWKARH